MHQHDAAGRGLRCSCSSHGVETQLAALGRRNRDSARAAAPNCPRAGCDCPRVGCARCTVVCGSRRTNELGADAQRSASARRLRGPHAPRAARAPGGAEHGLLHGLVEFLAARRRHVGLGRLSAFTSCSARRTLSSIGVLPWIAVHAHAQVDFLRGGSARNCAINPRIASGLRPVEEFETSHPLMFAVHYSRIESVANGRGRRTRAPCRPALPASVSIQRHWSDNIFRR